MGRCPAGLWTYCSIACKIAGLTRVEPRVQTAARVRISAPLAAAAAVLAAVAGGGVAAAACGGPVAVGSSVGGSAASAMGASPTAEHLPASNASLAKRATKATRVMRDPSIPAARRAERKTELERLASAVKDAQEERNTLMIASRGRYEDAIQRGVSAADRKQQTQEDLAAGAVLSGKVRDAQKARTEFAKMISRERDCIAAALDAVRDRLTAEEPLKQLPAATAMALEAVVAPPFSPVLRRRSVIAGEALAGLAAAGSAASRGLHSSTFQLNLSRFCH